ncbi:MAG: universal stress protein [Tetrasphaera sp.]|nr:universal stress protein [Tetrasphaera sp.]
MSIVVAYMPSPEGEAALDAAIAEAKLRGLRVVVVNATKGDALVDTHYASAEGILSLDQRLADCGVEHEIVRPMGADLSDLVLEAAENAAAELLVVGLRRRTPVGKLVLGSVSQRLLLDATIPVLAIHAKAGGRHAS